MATLTPLPPLTARWINADDGSPAQILRQYVLSLDALMRGLAGGKVGPLPSAANDAAAAKAGVGIGFLYENAGALRIRKV
jgi:hypothetical protein